MPEFRSTRGLVTLPKSHTLMTDSVASSKPVKTNKRSLQQAVESSAAGKTPTESTKPDEAPIAEEATSAINASKTHIQQGTISRCIINRPDGEETTRLLSRPDGSQKTGVWVQGNVSAGQGEVVEVLRKDSAGKTGFAFNRTADNTEGFVRYEYIGATNILERAVPMIQIIESVGESHVSYRDSGGWHNKSGEITAVDDHTETAAESRRTRRGIDVLQKRSSAKVQETIQVHEMQNDPGSAAIQLPSAHSGKSEGSPVPDLKSEAAAQQPPSKRFFYFLLCVVATSYRYAPVLSFFALLPHSRRFRLQPKHPRMRVFVCSFVVAFLHFPLRADGFGAVHSCFVESNGGLSCWGNNDYGQLGDGTQERQPTPVRVSGMSSSVANVALGSYNSCALLISGAVKCWGRNENGQLGDGTTTKRNTPVSNTMLSSGVVSLSVGGHGTGSQVCVVLSTGAVKCLGVNDFGQIGDGTTTSKNTPTTVSGLSSGGDSVAAGNYHSCALLSTGAVRCWGSNGQSQLGCGAANCGGSTCSCPFGSTCPTNDCSLIPKAVSGLSIGIISLHAGGEHSCVLLSNGGVQGWGSNENGQLGDGTTSGRVSAAAVNGLSSGVIALALGGAHSCVVLSTGGVKCWGDNYRGKLGDWTTIPRSTPTDVLGLSSGAISVFLGSQHTCAVLSSGRIDVGVIMNMVGHLVTVRPPTDFSRFLLLAYSTSL